MSSEVSKSQWTENIALSENRDPCVPDSHAFHCYFYEDAFCLVYSMDVSFGTSCRGDYISNLDFNATIYITLNVLFSYSGAYVLSRQLSAGYQ